MYAAGGGGGGGRGWDTADADARAFRVCEINIDGPTDTSLSFDLTVLYFFLFPLFIAARDERSRDSAFGTNIAGGVENGVALSLLRPVLSL